MRPNQTIAIGLFILAGFVLAFQPIPIQTGSTTTTTTTGSLTCYAIFYYASNGNCLLQTLSTACLTNYPNSPTYYTCGGSLVAACQSAGYGFNAVTSQCVPPIMTTSSFATSTTFTTTTVLLSPVPTNYNPIAAIALAVLGIIFYSKKGSD